MNPIRYALAAGAVCLCACSVAPSPTAPSVVAVANTPVAAQGFDSLFYRALVQNGYEAPDRLEPIRVLRGPLRIYLRTRDDAGGEIGEATLNMTERTLIDSAWIWSGETFRIVQVERGLTTREKMPGWITVKWSTASSAGQCGRSTIGVDGGFIEFNASGACHCGMGTVVYPRLVRHELGHAMGYYHTDRATDVMYGHPITSSSCDLLPSDRERHHAKFAHQ